MNKFGLPQRAMDEMHAIFAKHGKIKKVVLYGSRAMGNYKNGSDIDLTMCGSALTFDDLNNIAGELEESSIPYLVDLSIFDVLDHAKLKDHIKRHGRVFYDRYAGWKNETIGDVLSVIQNGVNCTQDKSGKGLKITRIETIADANINYNKTGFSNLDENRKQKAALKKGDILFSHINSPIHVGKTAIYDGNEPLYHGINLLRLNTIEAVDSSYFNLFLQSLFWSGYWKRTAKQSVNQASVNQTDIKKIPFSYPPLAEQQRIVAKLDAAFAEIDTAIAATNAKEAEIEKLKSALLGASLSGDAETWQTVKLGEYYDVRDGTHDSPKYIEDGFPLVTSKNLKDGKIDLSKIKYISEKDYQDINKRSGVDVGDVLMAMIGTIGNPVEIIEPPQFAIKNVALFKTNAEQSPAYLRYFLSHPRTVSRMMSDAKGATQKFVGLGYLRSFPISVPPLTEQQRIVAKLDATFTEIDKTAKMTAEKTNELKKLKSAILAQELQGETA